MGKPALILSNNYNVLQKHLGLSFTWGWFWEVGFQSNQSTYAISSTYFIHYMKILSTLYLQSHNNSRGNYFLFCSSHLNLLVTDGRNEGITHVTLWEGNRQYWHELGMMFNFNHGLSEGRRFHGPERGGFHVPLHRGAQFYLLQEPKPQINFVSLHKVDAIIENPKTMIEEKYLPYGAT